MANGTEPQNGRNNYVRWGLGAGAIFALPTTVAFIINLFVAPLDRSITKIEADYKLALSELRVEVRSNAAELKRIGDLAAERGVAIPRLAMDIQRVEAEVTRLRGLIDRMERTAPR